MKTSQIKTNPRNPRRITPEALEKLKQSIQRDPEFMTLRPMVIDESGMVLGGNQRLKAIKSLGMKDVPDTWVVHAKDLTEEQRKRFVVVDNYSHGDWDLDILSTDWELPELEDIGFSAAELGIFEDDPDTAKPPDDFPEHDEDIETEHECPKCGYKWS